MTTTLGKVVEGTVFAFTNYTDGVVWKKGGTCWRPGKASLKHPDFREELLNKDCHKCIPKLGGEFQPELGKFFPNDSEIEIS